MLAINREVASIAEHAVADACRVAHNARRGLRQRTTVATGKPVALLADRYIPRDRDHVRRSYAYARGPLKLFRDEPEMVVTSAAQITDAPE